MAYRGRVKYVAHTAFKRKSTSAEKLRLLKGVSQDHEVTVAIARHIPCNAAKVFGQLAELRPPRRWRTVCVAHSQTMRPSPKAVGQFSVEFVL